MSISLYPDITGHLHFFLRRDVDRFHSLSNVLLNLSSPILFLLSSCLARVSGFVMQKMTPHETQHYFKISEFSAWKIILLTLSIVCFFVSYVKLSRHLFLIFHSSITLYIDSSSFYLILISVHVSFIFSSLFCFILLLFCIFSYLIFFYICSFFIFFVLFLPFYSFLLLLHLFCFVLYPVYSFSSLFPLASSL